jgi:ribonucleoside-diphosphate reductase alpha chain
LPDTRQSITHKFSIAGHEGYITVGLFPDGRPGELFITMAKEGSTIGGLMDCFGTAVSMSLQYGVPLEVYVNKFSHTRFEPMADENPISALRDCGHIFRLGITFLPGCMRRTWRSHEVASSAGDSKQSGPPKAEGRSGRLCTEVVRAVGPGWVPKPPRPL